tara:strand:- start:2807 stop:3376 length:570 start_codon:yes stop_codon:yes gene_type:complete
MKSAIVLETIQDKHGSITKKKLCRKKRNFLEVASQARFGRISIFLKKANTRLEKISSFDSIGNFPDSDCNNGGNYQESAGSHFILLFKVRFVFPWTQSFKMDIFSSHSWKKSCNTGRFECLVCADTGKKSELSIQNAVRHFKLCHGMSAEGSKLHMLQKKWRKNYRTRDHFKTGMQLYIGSYVFHADFL